MIVPHGVARGSVDLRRAGCFGISNILAGDHDHLGEIGRATKYKIDRIDARVIDAKPASSDSREDQWWDLVQRFRKLRKQKAPSKK